MHIYKPEKPKFSIGFLIYVLGSLVFNILMLVVRDHSCWILALVLFTIVPFIAYILWFIASKAEYNLAEKDFAEYKRRRIADIEFRKQFQQEQADKLEDELQAAIASQKATEPWAVRYSTSPCPYCGHYKVRCAKWEDKSLSVAFWGIASSKLGKNYKCEHCGRMWE